MAYAEADDLKRRIGTGVYEEIYSRTVNDVTAVDLTDVNADLNAAGAEIDGAIASRYSIPVTAARSLALLKDWNLTLAEERAFSRPAGASFTEKVKTAVAQVRKYLEDVRSGVFRLPDAAEAVQGGACAAFTRIAPPVFGRDDMSGF